jgi:transcriptional regulator with PAS, ATPase and Fis domain
MKNDKTITLITGSRTTGDSLSNQLYEYLGKEFPFNLVDLDEFCPEKVESDLIIFSSSSLEEESREKIKTFQAAKYIKGGRTISHQHIDSLVTIPPGTEILFINDDQNSAMEGIDNLKKIGFNQFNYKACYPPLMETYNIKLAITAGETALVPSSVKQVFDLGTRVFDFHTLSDTLHYLKIDADKIETRSFAYLKKIVNTSAKLSSYSDKIKDLNNQLMMMVEGISEGLITYDKNGTILVANEKVRSMLSLKNRVAGINLKKIIFNKGLLTFLMTSQKEENKIFTIDNSELFISRTYHERSETYISSFKLLTDVEKNMEIQSELRKKGFFAKYRFEDIIGISEAIKRTKEVCQKLARSNLSILLEGESGTGKELLASAIHNHSKRNNKPYVAINMSSLNETLLESELFGYEEGSFTGARKGGKIGLFELADEGTIFLDEIGDISPKLQSGLLRVLQESEVMRIGGNDIKKIDVRVLCATNRDLYKMVREGKFREDLYYRIKQGYVSLAPLRERIEDIPLLLKYFLETESIYSPEVNLPLVNKLKSYSWPGTVRELKYIIAVMLAISESDILTLEDIPEGTFRIDLKTEKKISDIESFLMNLINDFHAQGIIAGRERLSQECARADKMLSISQIRRYLSLLENKGYIEKEHGHYGVMLTEEGKNITLDI